MFVVVDDVGRVFVDECFRPFSAALLDDGVYSTLCKETSRYIQAVNTAVEQSVLAFTLSDRCQLQPVALIVSLHLLLLLFFVASPEITPVITGSALAAASDIHRQMPTHMADIRRDWLTNQNTD